MVGRFNQHERVTTAYTECEAAGRFNLILSRVCSSIGRIDVAMVSVEVKQTAERLAGEANQNVSHGSLGPLHSGGPRAGLIVATPVSPSETLVAHARVVRGRTRNEASGSPLLGGEHNHAPQRSGDHNPYVSWRRIPRS